MRDLDIIFITGTAGSGKSLLTYSLSEWYSMRSINATTVNLDPGAVNLPYEPEVDIRDRIDLYEIMDRYQLGPNGALIFSSDLVATMLNQIQDDIDSINADYVLIDTPGQIELFAYRESGPIIVHGLRADTKILLFLIDPVLSNTPTNFLSLVLLSASVGLRMGIPRINVLTKRDIAEDSVSKIMKWSKDAALFEKELMGTKDSEQYLLYTELFRDLKNLSLGIDLYPISSVTYDGFIALTGEISRISRLGEEISD